MDNALRAFIFNSAGTASVGTSLFLGGNALGAAASGRPALAVGIGLGAAFSAAAATFYKTIAADLAWHSEDDRSPLDTWARQIPGFGRLYDWHNGDFTP